MLTALSTVFQQNQNFPKCITFPSLPTISRHWNTFRASGVQMSETIVKSVCSYPGVTSGKEAELQYIQGVTNRHSPLTDSNQMNCLPHFRKFAALHLCTILQCLGTWCMVARDHATYKRTKKLHSTKFAIFFLRLRRQPKCQGIRVCTYYKVLHILAFWPAL